MCPLGKILAQDLQMAAVTKNIGRRDKPIAPLLSTEKNLNTPNILSAHLMDDGDCDAAIAAAAATVTNVQSLSQEVGSGNEGLGLFGFGFSSSAVTNFWWLKEKQEKKEKTKLLRRAYTRPNTWYRRGDDAGRSECCSR